MGVNKEVERRSEVSWGVLLGPGILFSRKTTPSWELGRGFLKTFFPLLLKNGFNGACDVSGTWPAGHTCLHTGSLPSQMAPSL